MNVYTYSGITKATNVGQYQCTISLTDPVNYEWADGTTADIVHNWQIISSYGVCLFSPSDGTYYSNEIWAKNENLTITSTNKTRNNAALLGNAKNIVGGSPRMTINLENGKQYIFVNEGETDENVYFQLTNGQTGDPPMIFSTNGDSYIFTFDSSFIKTPMLRVFIKTERSYDVPTRFIRIQTIPRIYQYSE